jgi:hypothetical protein
LYALGAQDKIVQRILRHSRPHVARDCYIKVFDHTVLQATQKLEAITATCIHIRKIGFGKVARFAQPGKNPFYLIVHTRTDSQLQRLLLSPTA